MNKILNILFLLIVIIFIFSVYKYYSSIKNVKNTNFNRMNINSILKEKIKDLPVLINDTNNIIEFNDITNTYKNDDKKRSFWDLIKVK